MRGLLAKLAEDRQMDLLDILEESMSVGIWTWDIVRDAFIWSRGDIGSWGPTALADKPVSLTTWLCGVSDDDRIRVRDTLADAVTCGRPLDVTFQSTDRSAVSCGGPHGRSVHMRGVIRRNRKGVPLDMIGTIQSIAAPDISKQRVGFPLHSCAQPADCSTATAYINASPDNLSELTVGSDGRFTYRSMNPAGLADARKTLESVIGRTPVEIYGAQNGVKIIKALETVVETGMPVTFEPILAYGARRIVYECTFTPVYDCQGRLMSILCRARDISKELLLRSQLKDAQLSALMGQIAGAAVQDIDKALAVLHDYFERLSSAHLPVTSIYLASSGCFKLRQSRQSSSLFLQLGERFQPAKIPVTLNSAVIGSCELLNELLPNVEFCAKLTKDRCGVLADRQLLQACIISLCLYLHAAINRDCTIEIATKHLDGIPPPDSDLPSGQYAALFLRNIRLAQRPDSFDDLSKHYVPCHEPKADVGANLHLAEGLVRRLGGAICLNREQANCSQIALFMLRDTGS